MLTKAFFKQSSETSERVSIFILFHSLAADGKNDPL